MNLAAELRSVEDRSQSITLRPDPVSSEATDAGAGKSLPGGEFDLDWCCVSAGSPPDERMMETEAESERPQGCPGVQEQKNGNQTGRSNLHLCYMESKLDLANVSGEAVQS